MNSNLVKQNTEHTFAVQLFQFEVVQRDGITCFVLYRGTMYNYSKMADAEIFYDKKCEYQPISLFGGK